MTKYEREVAKAESQGLTVVDGYDFGSDLRGVVVGTVIVISDRIKTDRERLCVLWEELAHFQLNGGDILDQQIPNSRHQEHKAHVRMVRENLPLERIVETVASLGVDTNLYEVAEALEVSERFLREALEIYHAEYGASTRVGGYLVSFTPFNVQREETKKTRP